MGQVSATLRKVSGGYSHWCPGCEEMHFIRTEHRPDRERPLWMFNDNVNAPTFSPSVRIHGKQTVKVNGQWTGEWVRGADGKALDYCCHYFITRGELAFCDDSTHALHGKQVPLPELPAFITDDNV